MAKKKKISVRKRKSEKKEKKEKDSYSRKKERDPNGVKYSQNRNDSIYIINKKKRYDSFYDFIKRTGRFSR